MTGELAARRGTRKRDFAFSGLIECGACGCAIVGEIKKERYVYYHCTGYADKCRGNPASCRRKHIREEALGQHFTELLGRLHFDDDVLEWVRDAMHASHAEERREHDEAIKRLEAECKRLDNRIHAMYADKLDGMIDAAFFQKMSNQWREVQDRCQRDIERHRRCRQDLFERGRGASRTRERRPTVVCEAGTARKAVTSKFLTIELHLEGRRIDRGASVNRLTSLRKRSSPTERETGFEVASELKNEKWLPEQDSNLRPFD